MIRRLSPVLVAVFASSLMIVSAEADTCRFGVAAPVVQDRGGVPRIAVTAGDFDGNGRPDIVSLHRGDVLAQRVGTVLMNGGGMAFDPRPLIAAGPFEHAAALDVNGDGLSDLVLSGNGPLTVLVGNGDGTFRPSATFTQFTDVTSVKVADLDEDGFPDLVITESDLPRVVVLFGDAGATYREDLTLTLEDGAVAVTAADLDGDGHLDLVVVDQSSWTPLWGDGHGFFTFGTRVTGVRPTAIAALDLDRDGKPAVVVASGTHFDIYRRVSGRNFLLSGLHDIPIEASALMVADMDRDGVPDLVVEGNGLVAVVHANGDGTFGEAAVYSGGSRVVDAAVVDIDGDGFPDVAVANNDSADVSVLRNGGDGRLEALRVVAVDTAAGVVASGDFERDGADDILIGDKTARDLRLYPRGADGSIGSPFVMPIGVVPAAILVADFNGDGNLDAAVLSDDGMTLVIARGTPGAQFDPAPTTISFPSQVCCLANADFNADKQDDIAFAFAQGGVGVMLSTGTSFAPPLTFASPGPITAIAAGDLDGDATPDVVVAGDGGNEVQFFRGGGGGGLTPSTSIATDAVAALTVLHLPAGQKVIAAGARVDQFDFSNLTAALSYDLPAAAAGMAVADLNADGLPDIAVTSVNGALSILLAADDGTYIHEIPTDLGLPLSSVAPLETGGNGPAELVVVSGGKAMVARPGCERPSVALGVLQKHVGAGQPVTLVASAVQGPRGATFFTFLENGRVLGSTASAADEIGVGRVSVFLTPGVHSITVEAAFADRSTDVSDPIEVVVGPGRPRLVRH